MADSRRPKQAQCNVAYFIPGQRVLWHGIPGIIHSVEVKSYPYPIGYNVRLNSQPIEAQPDVINSGFREIDPLDNIYHKVLIPVPPLPVTVNTLTLGHPHRTLTARLTWPHMTL